MKSFVALIFTLLHLTLYSQSHTDIRKVIKMKAISYDLKGAYDVEKATDYTNADGMYYGKCMKLHILNLTDSSFSVMIKNGQMLMCKDTTVQDMVVTRPEYFTLGNGEEKTILLYAMCTEMHDAMPTVNSIYTFGEMSDKSLTRITFHINDMLLHNVAGQSAVWAYTDKATREELKHYDATDHTLLYSIEILNKAGVMTRINVVKSAKATGLDSNTTQGAEATKQTVPQGEATTAVNSTDVYVNRYWAYSAIAAVGILLSAVIFLMARKRKDKNA